MSKLIKLNAEAREELTQGINILADAVRVTMGPEGRTVVIYDGYGYPHVTKDGVTVAKAVELSDPVQNAGAQMIKEVADKTAEHAGDGTTTATVLAQAIIAVGMQLIKEGVSPVKLKKYIAEITKEAVVQLDAITIPVAGNMEKIEQVASISANNDPVIGKIIADAIGKLKEDGIITVEQSASIETYINIVEGTRIDRGFISPYFITNQEKSTAELESPLILLFDRKISDIKELMPIMTKVVKESRSLLIIAEDVDAEAIATLVLNKTHGKIKVAAIKAPAFGDYRTPHLEDLAILTGGKAIIPTRGGDLSKVEIADLGTAEKVIITKDHTTFVNSGGNSDAIKDRVNLLKGQQSASDSEFDKDKLAERIAKLSGGVGVLYVGASTESELKEKKDRIDDALAATRAAIEEGVVPGGGVALALIAKQMEKRDMPAVKFRTEDSADKKAYNRLVYTLFSPFVQICDNGGADGVSCLKHLNITKPTFGINMKTGMPCDLIEAGVIDPTKVTKTALLNAASVAAMVLTTECVIVRDAQILS